MSRDILKLYGVSVIKWRNKDKKEKTEMKVLGNKLVRAIAFLTACALLASAAFIMSDCAVKNDAQESRNQYYQMTSDYSESSNTLFVKLLGARSPFSRNL